MYQAPVGMVFAVAIGGGNWGIVRFFRGLAMGVLDVVTNTPKLPSVDWPRSPSRWVFFSFAPHSDETEAISLGVVPFPDSESEWSPPCYEPPDVIDSCYRIHHRGGITKTKDELAIVDMASCRTMTPKDLAAFLRARLEHGELRRI